MLKNNNSSFTLIELLVVLALVAILSVVVVVALNPAELLKQARDSNRLSDLATVNTALNLFSTDVINGFMGTSSIIYVSIPDSSPTCANLGLPTSTGYTYNCVTQQNLRNTDGTGWIPVNFQRISSNSPISQLPIDPTNTTSSNLYYTYVTGGSWKLTTILEAQKNLSTANLDGGTAPAAFEMGNNLTLAQTIFPNGWVKVPGNSTFGTSDFWVMKYEAKCADNNGNLLIEPDGSSKHVYDDTSSQCISSNSKYITSASDGYPVANLTKPAADSRCQSVGGRLITNNEWQTISWNIQNNPQNWSGNAVGSGYLYSGHGDNSPNTAIVASSDDNNGFINTGNSSGNQKRTHVLSNGQIVWDLSGNVQEWVDGSMLGENRPVGIVGAYMEWTDISNFGSLTREAVGPMNASWNSSQGMGKYYGSNTATGSIFMYLRGGSWSGVASTGIEYLYLNYSSGVAVVSAGFRCAK